MAHDELPADSAAKAVSHLGDCMTQIAANQRALLEEMNRFGREEATRFWNMRLERNGAALEQMQNCPGIPGLLGVQQEWLRGLMQDYAGQNLRLMGAWRGMAQDAMARTSETVSESLDAVQEAAGEAVEQMGEQAQQASQDFQASFVQETQH